jgi:hypothetical protein
MFLFIRLLLAHFLGDFPFQFNAVYKLKLTGLWGIIPHALIIGGCAVAMSWPFLNLPAVWFFIIFMTATHLIQDAIKLNFNSPKNSFWTYLLDQFSHVGLIAIMFFTDLKNLQPPHADGSNFFVWFYSSNEIVVYLIVLIAATYNGHFLIRCFKDTFIKNANPCDLYEKWFGMFERTMIVTFFFIRMPLWAIIPASLALRPLTYIILKKQLALHKCFVGVADMVLSWIVALLCGSILYLLQTRYPVY